MADPKPDAPWPPLRADLDIAQAEHEGRPVYVVADRERLAEHALAVSPAGLAVASLFDGRRSSAEISTLLAKEGASVSAPDIDRVGEHLASAGLLETADIAERRRRLIEDFKSSPV